MTFKKVDKSIKKKLNSAKLQLSCVVSETHHHKYKIYYKSKWIGNFKTSHGNKKEIGPGLRSAMARSLGLSKESFELLVSCPLTSEQFLEETKLI